MRTVRTKAVLLLLAGVLALGLMALAWAIGAGSSEAQQGTMHNCPQASKWAISVWEGQDGADTSQALANCGPGAVDFAYYIDPETQQWLRWFAGRADISNLTTLDNMQGVIAFADASTAAGEVRAAGSARAPQGAEQMHNCPQAGNWAISVWDGADGADTGEALAACGEGAVDFAYYIDPDTQQWLRYFVGRAEISNLPTLDHMQGVIAHGPAVAAPSVLKGKLIGAESQKPLVGAAIILCLVTAEKECSLKADLATVVKEDGSFELTEVPPASYVVFYDPSGKARAGWKEIDGLEMSLRLEGLSGSPSSARTELFSTFGGGGAITVSEGTTLEFEAGVVVGGEGSIISERYGLTLDFHEGKPITVQVQPGRITEIEIRAWAL